MSTEYTWQVTALKTAKEPIDGTVVTASGYVYGETDDGHNTTVRFSCSLSLPKDTDPVALEEFKAGFIPYNSLSKDTIVSWIKQELGPHGVQRILDKLDAKLAAFTNPLGGVSNASAGLPWGDPTVTTVIHQGKD